MKQTVIEREEHGPIQLQDTHPLQFWIIPAFTLKEHSTSI